MVVAQSEFARDTYLIFELSMPDYDPYSFFTYIALGHTCI